MKFFGLGLSDLYNLAKVCHIFLILVQIYIILIDVKHGFSFRGCLIVAVVLLDVQLLLIWVAFGARNSTLFHGVSGWPIFLGCEGDVFLLPVLSLDLGSAMAAGAVNARLSMMVLLIHI